MMNKNNSQTTTCEICDLSDRIDQTCDGVDGLELVLSILTHLTESSGDPKEYKYDLCTNDFILLSDAFGEIAEKLKKNDTQAEYYSGSELMQDIDELTALLAQKILRYIGKA
jgi:hypothetical protein